MNIKNRKFVLFSLLLCTMILLNSFCSGKFLIPTYAQENLPVGSGKSNIAESAAITAETVAADWGANRRTDKLTDGTKLSDSCYTSYYSRNEQIAKEMRLSYEKSAKVEKIVLYPRIKNDGKSYGFPKDFAVTAWNGYEWISLAEYNNLTNITQGFEINITEAVITNCIKISVTKLGNSDNSNEPYVFQLSEIEIFGTCLGGSMLSPDGSGDLYELKNNIALNAIADGETVNWAQGGITANINRLNNGKSDDFYSSNYSSDINSAKEVSFNLGADFNIESVVLFPRLKTENGAVINNGFPAGFTVSVYDGNRWNAVETVSGYNSTTIKPVKLDFDTVRGSGIKITATQLGITEKAGEYALQFSEIAVLGEIADKSYYNLIYGGFKVGSNVVSVNGKEYQTGAIISDTGDYTVKTIINGNEYTQYVYIYQASDTNSDNSIDICDLVALKNSLSNKLISQSGYAACDINGDGYMNEKDLFELREQLLNVYSFEKIIKGEVIGENREGDLKLNKVNLGLGGGTLLQIANRAHDQSMSYIIETPKNELVIIDGGNKIEADGKYLYNLIKSKHKKVSAWFITHAHSDHYGALSWMMENEADFDKYIKIDALYYDFPPLEWFKTVEGGACYNDLEAFIEQVQRHNLNVKQLKKGILEIGGLRLEVLNDLKYQGYNNINDTSIVIVAHYPKKDVMFLGDLAQLGGLDLLKSCDLKKLRCDIVQMAHHGQNGITENVYKFIRPRICLYAAPQWLWDNDEGGGENTGPYKTLETRAWMAKLNVEASFTHADGDYLFY